ncbi:MAG TPA: FHA domain-containing protein, partial [Promineifilum sp.]
AVVLGTAAAGMLLSGLAALFGAILFNLLTPLFGGIGVTLDAMETKVAPRPTAASTTPIAGQAQPVASPNRPAAATAWLVSLAGPDERLPINGEITRIGSAPDNDIVLAGLSPNHAEIRRESGRYLIYDLGSRRTWVNDVQVAAVHMLKDGFRLQLGSSGFVFQTQST